MDPEALRSRMTLDHQRDLEAHGLDTRKVIVARYCAECRQRIPIEDERTETSEWAAHVARHSRSPQVRARLDAEEGVPHSRTQPVLGREDQHEEECEG